MFTYELKSASGLEFQLSFWKQRTSQGHSQSYTL